MELLAQCVDLALKVKSACDEAKANKQQCKLLRERVVVLSTALQGLPPEKIKSNALQLLLNTLERYYYSAVF